MIAKSVFSVPVAILLSVLHAACCILPLLSVAASFTSFLNYFVTYKSVFLVIQLIVLGFIFVKLVRHYLVKNQFHSKMEKISYHISLIITVAGLLIGYFEPFKTENQKIAQQQFAFFKAHRQLRFELSGNYDDQKLRSDLAGMRGVKPNRIRIAKASIEVTYRNDQTSGTEILKKIKEKGYLISN